jgi:hypothetical protein
MEYLVFDLKERLIARRKKEYETILQRNVETDRDLILISAGRIIEDDFLIHSLEKIITYCGMTKKLGI